MKADGIERVEGGRGRTVSGNWQRGVGWKWRWPDEVQSRVSWTI